MERLTHAEEAGWLTYPVMEEPYHMTPEERKEHRRLYLSEYMRARRKAWMESGLTSEGTPRKRQWVRRKGGDAQ